MLKHTELYQHIVLYQPNLDMQACMLLKSLVVIGAIGGLTIGAVGTSVPWLFPNLFTTDNVVIGEVDRDIRWRIESSIRLTPKHPFFYGVKMYLLIKYLRQVFELLRPKFFYMYCTRLTLAKQMNKVLLPYFIALMVTPSTHSLEGTLLAGRDLRFMSLSMSACFCVAGLLLSVRLRSFLLFCFCIFYVRSSSHCFCCRLGSSICVSSYAVKVMVCLAAGGPLLDFNGYTLLSLFLPL
ncbi:hypothetical protein BHE74_00036824 [Ensete ventricosum]|nr:hypothetical protein BHE74_00036824 [Ensete ventricosum]